MNYHSYHGSKNLVGDARGQLMSSNFFAESCGELIPGHFSPCTRATLGPQSSMRVLYTTLDSWRIKNMMKETVFSHKRRFRIPQKYPHQHSRYAESKLPLDQERIKYLRQCFIYKALLNYASVTHETIRNDYNIPQKRKRSWLAFCSTLA